MNILVQKYGGTSVATKESRKLVVEKVLNAKNQGKSVVVVVSAMGRKPEPYATDSLLNLIEQINPDINARERDALMSCGENLAAVVITAELLANGCDAVSITGGQAGIVTTDVFGDARIKGIDTKRLMSTLKASKVAVVTGFQGITEDGDITTLGRGGSDTTATALGAALDAELVEIYTDVEGIMTADPRVVPDAKYQKTVSYRDLVEMANLGAKVIHPRAVEIAMKKKVPLAIKNTFSDAPGTFVIEAYEEIDAPQNLDNVVSAVANMSGVAQIKSVEEAFKSTNKVLSVFETLANENISVDMINVFTDRMHFIVDEKDLARTIDILENMKVNVEATKGCAKVSVVGSGMMDIPGVMSRFVKALDGAGVKILQTSDSNNSLSCLVVAEDMEKAARALHSEFKLSE